MLLTSHLRRSSNSIHRLLSKSKPSSRPSHHWNPDLHRTLHLPKPSWDFATAVPQLLLSLRQSCHGHSCRPRCAGINCSPIHRSLWGGASLCPTPSVLRQQRPTNPPMCCRTHRSVVPSLRLPRVLHHSGSSNRLCRPGGHHHGMRHTINLPHPHPPLPHKDSWKQPWL